MKSFFLLALLTLAVRASAAETQVELPLDVGQLQVEPSFEACSYYFRPPGGAQPRYAVEFRRVGDSRWHEAFEPVTDKPEGVWKGSLFNLDEDTSWEVRVLDASGAELIRPVGFRTWTSQPRIAKVVDLSKLPSTRDGLVISDQGTPDSWIKYTAPAGWRLERAYDINDRELAAITFRNARHVILENVTVVGGLRHAVLVQESDSVRILNCELSGWGRLGVQQFTNTGDRGKYVDAKGATINYDAGVSIDRSARTVVERCYVHDPRHRANSWMYSHPAGPTAVHVNATRGGTVLRWNDFIGSDEHRWNDVIEASSNGAANGGFFRDSDVTGNFLAFGNDDGVELEGGGMNVRFYRNKIEGTTCSISTAACILGPQFIFGNLITNPGDESGLALVFFKNGHGAEQGGKRHFINNTLHGPASAYGSYGKPIGTERIGFMRNNVFVGNGGRPPGDWARRDDFDRDAFWLDHDAVASRAFLAGLRGIGQEEHGLASDPEFVDPSQGDFHLVQKSPVRGQAAPVANLTAAGSNLGAFADDATEVPYRPLALTATPRQLNFSLPDRVSPLHVSLRVPASAKEPVPFVIRQNRVFTWFTVEPSRGTVAPGGELSLTVTVDPAKLHGRPTFKGAFLVRTPGGLSRPVSVYAKANFTEELRPASAPNSVYIAAASLPGLERFVQTTSAAGVAAGKYVALPGGGSAPEVSGKFAVAHAGRYSLLARGGISADVMQNWRFALTVDDIAEPAEISLHPGYEWNAGATNFRVVYLHALGELAAGEHRLRLRSLGAPANLNELIITDNPAAFFIDTWQAETEAVKDRSPMTNDQ